MNDATKQYVHLLNSTLTATERTICCILETFQTDTGVTVPEVLRPYMMGMDFIPFVNDPPKAQGEKPTKEKSKKGGDKGAKPASSNDSGASAMSTS